MATQPEDDEPLELTDKLEPGDDPEAQPGEENPDDAGGEVPEVSFEGEEPEPEADNSTIRQMRQELRETKRKLAEAEKASAPKPIEIGEKPTLAGLDYDEDAFDKAYDEWKERKAAAERQTSAQAEQSRKANEEWQQDFSAFEQAKAGLQFDDGADAVDTVMLTLNMVQQAVIVKSAADPALFFYALSKSPAKLSEVLKIEDPIKLAAAVARMEGAVKVTRKAPAPDRPARGSAVMPTGGSDKELERLEKEADRTGNRTAVINYKRAQKAAAEAK